MKDLDDIDKKIIARVQGDIPLTERPFDAWAEEIGIEPRVFVERLKALKDRGIVREMKAVLRHLQAGFSSGAMVAWAVPEDSIETKGHEIAARDAVSHCYERPGFGEYRLFSMIHGRSVDEVKEEIGQIALSLGISDYKVYWSAVELKKSSMDYSQEGLL